MARVSLLFHDSKMLLRSCLALSENRSLKNEWVTITPIEPMFFRLEENNSCSYLLVGKEAAVLIDSGYGVANFQEVCATLTPLPVTVVLTHGHVDHIGSARFFSKIYIHPKDAGEVRGGIDGGVRRWAIQQILANPKAPKDFNEADWDIPPADGVLSIEGGETLTIGDIKLEVLPTPGHSAGSVCLLEREQGLLFVGDTIVPGEIWLHLPDSTLESWLESAEMLAQLQPIVSKVLPGHGFPLTNGALKEVGGIVNDIRSGKAEPVQFGKTKRYNFDLTTLIVK